jgi:hypothetical protein
MNHPTQDALPRNRHLERALDRAHRLSQPGAQDHDRVEWRAEATHVGDLTALAALALTRPPGA